MATQIQAPHIKAPATKSTRLLEALARQAQLWVVGATDRLEAAARYVITGAGL